MEPSEIKSNEKNSYWKSFTILGLAIFIAFVFRYTIASPYKIPTGSMIPTLKIGDFLFVSKLSYGIKVPFTNHNFYTHSLPQAGDVVVFEFPENPKLDYIKRVVAVAGDTVEIRDHNLFINDAQVPNIPLLGNDVLYDHDHYERDILGIYRETIAQSDHLIMKRQHGRRMSQFGPYKVPKGHVFVMGDNRDNSEDSRFWGPLPIKNIRGKALFVWLSLNNHTPTAQLGKFTLPSMRWQRLGMDIR